MNAETLLEQCVMIKNSFLIIGETFHAVLMAHDATEEDRQAAQSMLSWVLQCLESVNAIEKALTMGVADTSPYHEFLISLENDISEAHQQMEIFAKTRVA